MALANKHINNINELIRLAINAPMCSYASVLLLRPKVYKDYILYLLSSKDLIPVILVYVSW